MERVLIKKNIYNWEAYKNSGGELRKLKKKGLFVTEILSSSSQTTSWIGIELNAAGVHPRQPQTVRNSPSTFSVFFFLFSFFIVPKLICFIILSAGKKAWFLKSTRKMSG
jgi:hypothetical protein